MYAFGEKVWTDSNDGSGSGLNADQLDGLEGSQFLRSDIQNSNAQFTNITVTDTIHGHLAGTANNANTLDNHFLDISPNANKIALRDTSGDLQAMKFRSFAPNDSTMAAGSALAFRNEEISGADNGIRFVDSNAEVRGWLDTLSVAEIQAALAQKADIAYVNSRATKLAFDKGMFEGI